MRRILVIFVLIVLVAGAWGCSAEVPEAAEARIEAYVSARWTKAAPRLYGHLTEQGRNTLVEKVPEATDEAPRVKTIDEEIRRVVEIEVTDAKRDGNRLTVTAKVTQPDDLSFREELTMVSFQAESAASEGSEAQKVEAAQEAAAHFIKTADVETKTVTETFELVKEDGDWRVEADVGAMEDLGPGFHVRDYGKNPPTESEADKPGGDSGSIADHPLRGTVDGETFELKSGYAEKSDREDRGDKVKLFGADVPECEQPADRVSVQVTLPAEEPVANDGEIGFVGFNIPTPETGSVSGFAASNSKVRIESVSEGRVKGGLTARVNNDEHNIEVSGTFDVPVVECEFP